MRVDGANVEADLIEHGARIAHELTAADRSDRRARQAAGEDIFSDCLIRKLAQLLMDNDDPRIQRVAGFMGSESFAPQFDRSLIGLIDAGQDLHEGRFAGAVLAHDAKHLALIERQGHVVENRHTEKRLGDAVHFEKMRRRSLLRLPFSVDPQPLVT